MKQNFEKAFDMVVAHEAGYTEDPRDPGNHMPDGRPGCTIWGCTMKTWEEFVGYKVTKEFMKTLKPKDVAPLYRASYWDAVRADDLPAGVDYAAFDFAINAGASRARKLIQAALGLPQDGIFGPMTMAAIAKADGPEFLKAFSKSKEAFYRSLPTFKTYGKGWLNRVRDVEVAAVKMVDQGNLA